MKIALLAICIGKYDCFLADFAASAAKYFFPADNVELCLWADRTFSLPLASRIFTFPTELSPWPGPTLWRYRLFLAQQHTLEEFDSVFYCDIDMEFCAPVQVLGDIVATVHPGFYNRPVDQATFERCSQSRACVARGRGRRYYAGGFQGGHTAHFLKTVRQINSQIEDDFDRGIIATWHDESHWNRYLVDNPPDVELSPWYCWAPECANDYPEEQARIKVVPKNARQLRL